MRWLLATWLVLAVAGCGDDGVVDPDGGLDGSVGCSAECDDGYYCNGPERCDPTSPMADFRGCVGDPPPCERRFCNEGTDVCDCTEPDADGDGERSPACGGADCDDGNAAVNPSATEVCDAEGVDEDCDPTTWGATDADGDGALDAACCNGPACGTDCDDDDAGNAPGQTEVCDGADQDCDGRTDEGVATIYYADTDGDGFGDASAPMSACALPSGHVDNGDDCDDGSDAVYPEAPQLCDTLGDNGCGEGTPNPWDADLDGQDRYSAISCTDGPDCDDLNSAVYAGAPEICDGEDSNCDGAEIEVLCVGECDGTCTGECEGVCDGVGGMGMRVPCAGACDGYCDGTCSGTCDDPVERWTGGEDADGDGQLATDESCSGGPRGDLPRTDCDDANPNTFAGAEERCDGADNDCDGVLDEAAVTYSPESQLSLPLSGGTAPDLSCRGTRTLPTPGATVSSTLTIVSNDGGGVPLIGATVEVWSGPDATSVVCSAPDCQTFTTDGSGEVVVSHPADAVLAIVVRGDGPYPDTIHRARLGSGEPVELVGELGFGGGSAGIVYATDCVDDLLAGMQLRVYRADGSSHCGVGPGFPNHAIGAPFTPDLSADGELFTVEAWGHPMEGDPIELLGREQIRIRPGAVSVLSVGPLRADGPPAP